MAVSFNFVSTEDVPKEVTRLDTSKARQESVISAKIVKESDVFCRSNL